ncbi:MAG: DUF4190 domain-containing protein [Bacteroidales bacterium]|nr:DUF4190 domain-containing protein [Bacteroidales bacterium]
MNDYNKSDEKGFNPENGNQAENQSSYSSGQSDAGGYQYETTTSAPHGEKFGEQKSTNLIQTPVPNANAVLVLGIISIVTCCCYGVPGTICGVIALILYGGANKAYWSNPEQYTQVSYKNLNAGKITAIIGLSLSALVLIWFILVLAFNLDAGFENLEDLEELIEEFNY